MKDEAPMPTPKELRAALDYDPATGIFLWKERPVGLCGDEKETRRWNARHAGTRAFANTATQGYRRGSVLGRTLNAHRVAWAIHYGEWPDVIDHINGNRADNRISNLRNATVAINNKNRKRPKTNSSGHAGISFDKSKRRWQAYISVGGKQKNLGRFKRLEDAVEVRNAAVKEYGYAKHHGR